MPFPICFFLPLVAKCLGELPTPIVSNSCLFILFQSTRACIFFKLLTWILSTVTPGLQSPHGICQPSSFWCSSNIWHHCSFSWKPFFSSLPKNYNPCQQCKLFKPSMTLLFWDGVFLNFSRQALSCDPPASAYSVVGITGMHAWWVVFTV